MVDFELEVSCVLNDPPAEWIEVLDSLGADSPRARNVCLWPEPQGDPHECRGRARLHAFAL